MYQWQIVLELPYNLIYFGKVSVYFLFLLISLFPEFYVWQLSSNKICIKSTSGSHIHFGFIFGGKYTQGFIPMCYEMFILLNWKWSWEVQSLYKQFGQLLLSEYEVWSMTEIFGHPTKSVQIDMYACRLVEIKQNTRTQNFTGWMAPSR